MEEKKEKKKISKVYIVIFTLAIVSAILGVFDLKANAAEYQYSVNIKLQTTVYNNGTEENTKFIKDLTLACDMPIYLYVHNQPEPVSGPYSVCAFAISQSDIKGVSNRCRTFVDNNGNTWYCAYDLGISGGYSSPYSASFEWIITGLSDVHYFNREYTYDEFVQAFKDDTLDLVIDYSSFDIDDEMPIVQNLNFDRIENVSNNGVNNIKTITDYIRFEPNFDYKLLIMVCPSVYSTIGDNDYVSKFDLYEYEKWVVMATSDVGLKEINCEIGQFVIPTNSVDCIVSSNYKEYYEDICYGLSTSGELVFKPTMGYRLAYVDQTSGIIGPSTYIIPNYYDNLDPDDETYSNFVLYSDGTHSSEKIMNLETWQQEEGTTIDSIKDSIDYVNDKLSDYNSANSNVNVQEVSNWLKTVANFISGTPAVVGSVLSFLPQPILYGLYICIFLGVIASGYAIVKALI